VFGMGMNIKKLANDHGITFDVVKTAAHADNGSMYRPMTEPEQAKMQELVDSIYGDFLKNVAANRKITTNQVDELGQGRVWSGADALKHGLVDEMGGLNAAIADAAKRAKLSQYAIVEYPQPKEFLEALAESLNRRSEPLGDTGLAGRVMREARTQLEFLNHFNDPLGVYARLPFDVSVR
jgi:protease IV